MIALRFGNIITYQRSDGEIITHRIKRKVLADYENAYITQGDNNDQEDEEIVRYNMIIGKVVYTMPRFGKIVKLLKNKIFFIFSLVLLVFILFYDKRIMKRKMERKEIRKEYEENAN